MNPVKSPVPIIGFAAYSGTGKTTLLTGLIPILKQKNLNIAVIKHAHHDFDIDHPGKDSYQIRKSGADQMLIASSKRWALMVENKSNTEASLQNMINQLDTSSLDLILVEGFKHESFPKIELHRSELNYDYLFPDDPTVVAVATDRSDIEASSQRNLVLLDINNLSGIADYICDNVISRKSGNGN